MAGRDPEHDVRWPVMRQAWRDVVFVHWAWPPEAVGAELPRGFTVDTYDGAAWVALSAFQVAACGLGPLPPVPLWAFPEANLRTYVTGPDGNDGIWFLNIEAQTLAVTVGARLGLGAPYHHATMTVDRVGDEVHYTSRRPAGAEQTPSGYDLRIRIGDPVDDADRAGLVDWCTGRWRAWTTNAGLRLRSPVRHQPWPLRHADLLAMEQTLTAGVGFPAPAGDPVVHYSPGVDARLGAPRPVLPC